jgi:hypothetical protein
MVAMSTVDMGLAEDILRDDEMEMRLLDIDVCEDRPETEDEGEMDRGVEMSEFDVLYAYDEDAMACMTGQEGEKGKK